MDGGAYPEIHIKQFPLEMGRIASLGNQQEKALALQTDQMTGSIKYEVVLHGQGGSEGKKKIIHSKLRDMQEQDTIHGIGLRPDEESVDAATEKTRSALLGIVEKRMDNNNPHKKLEAGSREPVSFEGLSLIYMFRLM